MDTHNTATLWSDDSFQDATTEDEEDFPTTPQYDNVWLEDSVPDWHFSIHEQSQPHAQWPYCGPYSLDQLHSAPEDTPGPHYKMMDLSDIFNLQDMMATTSDEDMLNLEYIFGLWIWTVVWINVYTPQTLYTWTDANCMKQDGYVFEQW